MQQSITRRDVYEPTAPVTINGAQVDVSSVKTDRALPDPLARGELRSAEAQIVAVDGPDVTDTTATPWDPASQWPPVKESPATVAFDTGSGPVAALTGGRVTRSEGGTDDRPVYVEVLDQYQSLDKTISWDSAMDAMPSESEAVTARYVGMQSIAVTDLILRHCGWYSTPPRAGYTALSVPAQGTMWPESGTVVTSQAITGVAFPGWLNTPWGIGVTDVDARYSLGGAYSIRSRGRMEMTAMTSTRASETSTRLEALSSGAGMVRIWWSQTTASLWIRDASGNWASIISVPRVDGLLYATVEHVSGSTVRATIRSGSNVTEQVLTVPTTVLDSVINEGRIVASATSGGFQIGFPSTSGSLVGWTPNAVLYPRSSGRNSLMVRNPVDAANCAELLAQQCAADCATYWIDELGILRWWDLARLESQAVAATVTGRDDITREGFRWSNDPSTVRSRVSVKWQEPARNWSWRTSVDLWQGKGATVQPNTATASDPQEDWINVPDDEVWIMPDLTLNRVAGPELGDFNLGVGSHYGAVTRTADDKDQYAQNTGSFLVTITRISDTAFKSSIVWTGSAQAYMRAPSEDSTLEIWRQRRGFDLPILRGKAKIMFTDRLTYSAQSGPATAPEHTIDAGFWIQRADQAQYTADYAGARMTVQQPTISEFPLVMIPGLQIGDVIEAVESSVSRLTVRGIVIRDTRSLTAGMDVAHSIAIRPTQVSRNGVTWEEWGAVMAGRSWETWGAQQSGKTWQDWGSDPLAGEEY